MNFNKTTAARTATADSIRIDSIQFVANTDGTYSRYDLDAFVRTVVSFDQMAAELRALVA